MLLSKKLSILVILLYSMSSFSQVVINEYSVSNLNDFTDNHNKYEDWIELYNTSTSDIDLAEYSLSDKPGSPRKWSFPAGTIISAKEFLVIWASGRDTIEGSHIHTNFKLSQTKATPESIVFSQPNGELIEEIELLITQNHHSRGRTTDGGAIWAIFTSPSIGSFNSVPTSFERYSNQPTITKSAGFYSNPF